MKSTSKLRALLGALAIGLGAASAALEATAATIVINNINDPGVGFNDPTPVAPVGGNPGTTLGQQRLNAFSYAANIWGANLSSSQPIIINARFTALTCSANSAVLGSAGATSVFRDFPGAPKPATWYPFALANKITGTDLNPGAAQINANFNANLGQPNCLTGTFFYLGLDGNHGTNIDFVATLLHEMGHGLGFQNFTSGSTGNFLSGFPSVWDHYLTDANSGLPWKDLSASQRQASALSVDKLIWNGPLVTAAVPSVLRLGVARLNIGGPASGGLAGYHPVGEASFGPPLSTLPVGADIMPVVNSDGTLAEACSALSTANARAVNGRVALVRRGTCGFTFKVKNAQNAGAIGVLVADNAIADLSGLGGSDATITIPSVRITKLLGDALMVKLQSRSRTASGVSGALLILTTQYAGADMLNRMMMYAPSVFASGSSVSHFDTTATRNLLMEPAISGDLTQSVQPPQDLTLRLLQDIGW